MPGRSRPPRALLVDDDADLCAVLSEVLTREGYEVRAASSRAAAMAAAEAGFDVALVDLRLPDGDGTELAARLKERHPIAEVVLLTGHATVESAAAAVRAGACAYLVKPCATEELLLTLEQALRHVRLEEEKRELARRAAVAEKLAAVGTMTAGLSHEIRNPLNAALLQLSVVERRARKLPADRQPALLEPLALVRDEIRRLDHILEDFLQFARPREFHPRPVDVSVALRKVLDLLGGDAERRGVRLRAELSPVPPVRGEEERLRQVAMNLALNALQATPAGGEVRVACRAEEPDGEVVIEVDDTGPGLPAGQEERLFEPFFTTKPEGSGLGLPIVHAIVQQHGGSVTAGRAPGGGARFAVRLPRA